MMACETSGVGFPTVLGPNVDGVELEKFLDVCTANFADCGSSVVIGAVR